jgi:hypothetical protein
MTLKRRAIKSAAVVLALTLTATGLLAQDTRTRPQNNRSESVGVHGHWTIEVRNRDGSLARRHEFKNALQNDGARALVDVLAGTLAFGPMSVILSGSPSPCGGGRGGAASCVITPIAATQSQPVGALVLTGSVTADNNGTINLVQTRTHTECGPGPTGPPGSGQCATLNLPLVFTAHSFDTPGSPIAPIPVVTGQIIQVTVMLSFS